MSPTAILFCSVTPLSLLVSRLAQLPPSSSSPHFSPNSDSVPWHVCRNFPVASSSSSDGAFAYYCFLARFSSVSVCIAACFCSAPALTQTHSYGFVCFFLKLHTAVSSQDSRLANAAHFSALVHTFSDVSFAFLASLSGLVLGVQILGAPRAPLLLGCSSISLFLSLNQMTLLLGCSSVFSPSFG